MRFGTLTLNNALVFTLIIQLSAIQPQLERRTWFISGITKFLVHTDHLQLLK